MSVMLIVLLIVAGSALLGCGGEGLGFILNPGGGSTSPDVPGAGDVSRSYLNLVGGYARGEPTILGTEQTYKPGFVQTALGAVGQTTPDWLSLFSQNVGGAAGAQAGANTFGRGANIGDVASLGPQAAAAVRGVNPLGSNLADQFAQTASTQLSAGTQLAPADVSRVTQGVRGDWARRGLGPSAPGQLDEAVQLATQGQNVLAQREAAAAQAAAVEQGQIGAPALGLLTGQSQAPQMGAGLLGQEAGFAQGAGPTLFPQSAQYDIFNTAYNARAAANIAAANNQAALDAY